jgi:chaperonin GroEL (HSP60 family)
MVVRRAMKFSAIVAGGGAIEMELSRLLINFFLFKDI